MSTQHDTQEQATASNDKQFIQNRADASLSPEEYLAADNYKRANTIAPMVASAEALTKLRIQTGNRIAAGFATRTGMKKQTDALAEDKAELENLYKKILEDLRFEYDKIVEWVLDGNGKQIARYIVPPKRFVPSPMFSKYSELALMDQYVRFMDQEELAVEQLETALDEYPIYTRYLKNIAGIGPKMAGVLISELNPYKAKYVSSFIAYAGLDTVILGRYEDDNGKDVVVSWQDIMRYYRDADENKPMYVNGKQVEFFTKGRSRASYCQTDVVYINKEGKTDTRKSLGYNPFLKTKLVGVIAANVLKQTVTMMNGQRSTSKQREALAREMGFTPKRASAIRKEVDAFLNANGHHVYKQPSRFGQMYYEYKDRLENQNRRLDEKDRRTPAHIHAMALRKMAKEILRELHIVWRHLLGLPIYQDYETAKLGFTHSRNQTLYDMFGIDTASLQAVNPMEVKATFYPQANQEYLEERSGRPIGPNMADRAVMEDDEELEEA